MKIRLEEKHLKWGITAFLVIVCSTVFFFAVYRFDAVQKLLGVCAYILTPFIYGLVMAYLLCPVYNFTVRSTYRLLSGEKRSFPKALTVSKAVGTTAALITMFVVVTGVLWMIIPGLVESIMKVIKILPGSMEELQVWIDEKLVHFPEAQIMLDGWIDHFTENAVAFVTETMLPEYSSIATHVSEGVIGVFNILKNIFVAIIICAYFLNIKDTFAAQSKKIIIALFRESTAKEIMEGAAFTNKTFGGIHKRKDNRFPHSGSHMLYSHEHIRVGIFPAHKLYNRYNQHHPVFRPVHRRHTVGAADTDGGTESL